MTKPQIIAAAELAWLGFLFWLAIWAPASDGVGGWNIAAFILFFATITVSLFLRRPSIKESGLRVDNLLPALGYVGVFVFGALILTMLVAGGLSSISAGRLLQSVFFGVFQQTLMLGYFFPRWRAVFPSPLAALANALCFALFHLPDIVLVTIAGVGQVVLTGLYLRVANVLAIGLAHGVLALVMLSLLLGASVMQTPRVGPPRLSAIAATIDRIGRRADQFAICSKIIAPDQFGEPPKQEVKRVLRGMNDEVAVRRSLDSFLGQERTAVCIITEREFYRYFEPSRRDALFIAAEHLIWRNPGNKPAIFERDPFLGIFRDRVLLVSNRPLA